MCNEMHFILIQIMKLLLNKTISTLKIHLFYYLINSLNQIEPDCNILKPMSYIPLLIGPLITDH